MDGKDTRVFVLVGDGECQEGQVWEAAMAAGFHRPENFIVIVDYNKMQLDGPIADILDVSPLGAKWSGNEWLVREIDGHDLNQVVDALQWAVDATAPACIVANTIKGKGVSFMENDNKWHGVAPTEEEAARAIGELRSAAHASLQKDAAAQKEAGR
jgi:transketolase